MTKTRKEYRRAYYLKHQERLKAYSREFNKNHPEVNLAYQRRNRERLNENARRRREADPKRWKGYGLKRYGITLEQWEQMLIEQKNSCEICKLQFISRKNIQVDHCHITGTTRKLLCSKCNMLVGFLEGPEELLKAAMAYLESFKSGVRR